MQKCQLRYFEGVVDRCVIWIIYRRSIIVLERK